MAMPVEQEESERVIRARWCMDGAASLAEAAARLFACARELFSMHEEGWVLESPIEDDYGIVFRRKRDYHHE